MPTPRLDVPPEKARADWEKVESTCRAGVLSIREIARLHRVTDTAIRKKTKELQWQRDLSGNVAQEVRSDLVRTPTRVRARPARRRPEGAYVKFLNSSIGFIQCKSTKA